jgi:hypothetical protein
MPQNDKARPRPLRDAETVRQENNTRAKHYISSHAKPS